MISKNVLAILTSIAVLTTTMTYISPSIVLASSDSSDHPDNAGDASSQLAQSEDNNDPDNPGGAMGDHSREGSFAGDQPFDENPITGQPDKNGRLGLGNIAGGNPGEVLCSLGHIDPDDDVEC